MTSLRTTIRSRETRAKTVKFHRLDSIMEEAMYTFQIVVGAEQQIGGTHKNHPLV